MCDFNGSTKVSNSRVMKVVNAVEDMLAALHNEVRAVNSLQEREFKPSRWQRFCGIKSLEQLIDIKLGDEYYSDTKKHYILSENKRRYEKIAESYKILCEFTVGLYYNDLYTLRFEEQYLQLRDLVLSDHSIRVNPDQMKFISYIETRLLK